MRASRRLMIAANVHIVYIQPVFFFFFLLITQVIVSVSTPVNSTSITPSLSLLISIFRLLSRLYCNSAAAHIYVNLPLMWDAVLT